VYYTAQPGATMHVFIMGADGSDVHRVTTRIPTGGMSWIFPHWAPGGDRLSAFVIGGGGFMLEPSADGTWREVELPRVGSNKEGFTSGAWSQDGRRIVGVTAVSAQLVVYDVDRQTYEETSLRPFNGQQGLTWLPDGRRVLGVQSGNIVLVDVATRKVSVVIDPPARQLVRQPRLTAAGRRLFYLHTNNESDIALMTIK
ncbi:MAG: TolB family protein, partial [Vicinamibacterales bacterium]